MASVVVLYLQDAVVGPHLELIRRLCNPDSTSKPHVTVRYFDKLRVPEEYLRAEARSIDILGPGAFGLERGEKGPKVVYLGCEADDLLPLEHKPHFPSSEFHITVYEGGSVNLAKGLLSVLHSYEWNVRVELPPGTRLTRIQLKKGGQKKRLTPKQMPARADLEALFEDATKHRLDWTQLQTASVQSRLQWVDAVCRHLHEEIAQYPRLIDRAETPGDVDPIPRSSKSGAEPDIHLTPPELANAIARYTVDLMPPNAGIHFGDPAVGNGAFYGALLKEAGGRHVESAIGIDISAKQVTVAKRRWSRRGMEVRLGDYLHMDQLPARNLILANPPYLRHQGIPANYKEELRQRASVVIGTRINARSGLYVYFLLLSHQWMSADAIAAWLLPAEFMRASYGQAIRHYLTHAVELVRIHQFAHSDPQFENAKVLPTVVVFRNRAPAEAHVVHLSFGGSLERSDSTEWVPIEDLRRVERWSMPFRKKARADAGIVRIGDLFTVKRGIATGANDFFIMERARARREGIPKIALRPILPKARKLPRDIVEPDSDGYPRTVPQLCVLDCELPESQIRKRFPRLLKYLKSGERRGIVERTLLRERHPWYRQDRRDPAPFLFTYMGRGANESAPLRFIWNKSKATATNTYLLLYPRPRLARLLEERPEFASDVFATLQATARETLYDSARVHADGLHKMEPGELVEVPVIPAEWIGEAIEQPSLKLSNND